MFRKDITQDWRIIGGNNCTLAFERAYWYVLCWGISCKQASEHMQRNFEAYRFMIETPTESSTTKIEVVGTENQKDE